MTALVVEDQDAVRLLVTKVLRAMGWRTVDADGADAALEAVASEPVDLVVTDVSLGDGSGLVLARRVRELHPNAKVLFVSGHGPGELRTQAAGEGVPPPGAEPGEAVLSKPFELADLRTAVTHLMATPA